MKHSWVLDSDNAGCVFHLQECLVGCLAFSWHAGPLFTCKVLPWMAEHYYPWLLPAINSIPNPVTNPNHSHKFPKSCGAQNGIAKECELRRSAELNLLISNHGRNPLWGWPNISRTSGHSCSETGKPGLIVMCWSICLWHQYYLELCWRRSGLEQETPLSVKASAAWVSW